MNLAQSFVTNSPWLDVMIFMLAAVLTALVCHFVARTLLGPHIAEDAELLAGRIMVRVGTLHALILALIFAQEMSDCRDIFRIVSKEASMSPFGIPDIGSSCGSACDDPHSRRRP